jgi:hypothetical protein
MDIVGIAPTSIALQAIANLSQLNVQNGAERTRTVIVFIDSEVHTPFCHNPKPNLDLDFGFNSAIRIPKSAFKRGGLVGFEPTFAAFTVRCFAN